MKKGVRNEQKIALIKHLAKNKNEGTCTVFEPNIWDSTSMIVFKCNKQLINFLIHMLWKILINF